MPTITEIEKDPFNSIFNIMKEELDDVPPSHDISHYLRVFEISLELSEELDADKLVTGAASLTHDIHRNMGDGYVDPSDSLNKVEEILRKSSFPKDKIEEVLHCVEVHEQYGFDDHVNKANTIEAMIVQDADNLDAIGAVGIARGLSYCGENKNTFWEKENTSNKYVKENLSHGFINHVDQKLLKLKDQMNTEPAIKKAQKRHEYLKNFSERLKKELSFDD